MNSWNVVLSSGLSSYRVYQRDQDNTAVICFSGSVEKLENGMVECILYPEADDVKCIYSNCTEINNGTFDGKVTGVLPGHYRMIVRIIDTQGTEIWQNEYVHVGVGDIFLLAGQSNMFGCGKLINLETPSPDIHNFYYGDKWDVAKEPLCAINEALDPVYWDEDDEEKRRKLVFKQRYTRESGSGLGLTFAKEVSKFTGVPVGLVICAKGGTSMEQWSPYKAYMGGRSLYGSMLRRVNAVGGKVKALLWYQGESEASNNETAVNLRRNFGEFINAVRRDLNQPDLPVAYVQLAKYFGEEPNWKIVQAEQLAFEKECPNVTLVASVDSGMSDEIHIDSLSQQQIGRRMAVAIRRLCYNDTSVQFGPRLKNIYFEDAARKLLKLFFEGLNERLLPTENIRGIRVFKDDEEMLIEKLEIDEAQPDCLLVKFFQTVPEGSELWNGYGNNPVCNLNDARNMLVPAFGPVRI
jgi:sialate O-acetylesterase